jgi:hypothetical protein
MAPDPNIMRAVETLDYRVTPGDVASQVGIDIKLAEQGLLVLASEAGGHLQVSESGEVAYLFPPSFRTILQGKYLRLRLQAIWSKVWQVLFYLIRISFGILLILSIVLIVLAIAIILIALSSSQNNENSDRRDSPGGGLIFLPRIWLGPDIFWLFSPNYSQRRYYHRRPRRERRTEAESQMNFLEAIFSFLFGDGNPNADLEERRWQAIATVIRNHQGAIVAEQIAPYLDQVGEGYGNDYEDYMLPVLTRFNGRPEVSPEGQLIYHFPELQVMATRQQPQPVSAYFKESLWRFSEATSGQIMGAIALGAVNIVGALVLGYLLKDGTIAAQIGGLVAFVSSIYGILLAYGIGFLSIPLIRYFWIKGRNAKIEARNEQRLERAQLLNQAGDEVRQKMTFARQFASETVIDEADLAYTTEQGLTEQELSQADKIDAEWRRRLEQSNPGSDLP